jgi:hypothetical protein
MPKLQTHMMPHGNTRGELGVGGGIKMARGLLREEQYLLDTVADFRTQMNELERLREAVRLAEVSAKGGPSSRPISPEVVDLSAGPQLRV